MRAQRLVAFGDPPRFEIAELPDPVPGPAEAVVALRAAALNRRDWWVWTAPGYCPLPVTLGSDGAGVVVAVGEGVDHVATGDEVVIDPTLNWGAAEERPLPEFDILGAPVDGTFAEQVVVPAANLAAKPERLSWAEAAAINLGGLTAWRAAVTCAGAAPARTLLVTGAGSGVASFLIQIAAALGARVFVTSSSEAKLERARTLGAVGGVSYREPDWAERIVNLAGGELDAAIDSYGGPSWEGALRTLRSGGTLVSFGDTSGPQTTLTTAEVYWRWRTVRGTSMGSPREYRAMLAHVAGATWRPAIDSVFGLDELDAAARRLDAHDRFGKVVLSIEG
ncbi:MAG TPA: zinc-binding dehydrogenase [Solirubrobacteraceae bacterium]|jgi:NADPH:quinone reductase-like Zn-dependent oxidoreductase|nr:zinc-binding dehydrogenase [Solirubrobacteraceae bacterium]